MTLSFKISCEKYPKERFDNNLLNWKSKLKKGFLMI